MAHKLKMKSQRRINRDGSVGTKNEYVVRCKCRGKLCMEETFQLKRDAENAIQLHWDQLKMSRQAERNLRGKWITIPKDWSGTVKILDEWFLPSAVA